ncbi:siderophore-interacting protein [Glutamicibacter sp. NPDC087344]|uniref:siderophore-interacting protein n=1 Tax=Glutamicibacter sp. NPDC087344 TaxID=3363994 RepID=UPI00382EDA12
MAIPCSPARVLNVERISPNMQRIRFETVGSWRWFTDGIGDERIDIALPRPGHDRAELEIFNSPEYGRGWVGEEPPWRHYTVRRVENSGRHFDIDFVIHAGGLASAWAERAEAGHVIGVFDGESSSSYYRPPADAQHHLLVADATGLPGLARIVEQLPAHVSARALIEVPDPADILVLPSAATVQFDWITGSGNGLGPSRLAAAVQELSAPAVPWYAWVACESAASRSIRKDLRSRLDLARDRHHVIGYWTQDLSGDRAADLG